MKILKKLFYFYFLCFSLAQAQTYTVFTENNFYPFVAIENGQHTGFDVEILRAIADVENLNLKFESDLWENLIPRLQSGDADVIATAITITNERAESMSFTDPYFDTQLAFFVNDPEDRFHTSEDLIGEKIGVLSGSIPEEKLSSLSFSNIVRYKKDFDMIRDVLKGGLVATLNDSGFINYYYARFEKEYPIKRIFLDDNHDYYSFVVAKDNDFLLNKLNNGLKIIKENGTYDRIYEKYFSN